MKKYDVIVIGSGTAGQTAAYRLEEAGLDIALIDDSDKPGGTCALSGCQPKKWFYEVAEVIAKSRHLDNLGITVPAVGDWQSVWRQKQKFVENIPEGTVKELKGAGIDFIEGTAGFEDDHTVSVNGDRFSADFFILATGAEPSLLPFPGAEYLVTSTEFLARDRLPDRIIFVGGGFISFEFAHFAARIGPGERELKILEAASRPLGPFDEEMVVLLVSASNEAGIDVMSNIQITSVEKQGDQFYVRVNSGMVFEADLVVHGASRTPRTDGLNFEKIDVSASKRGIDVNPEMQTTVPPYFCRRGLRRYRGVGPGGGFRGQNCRREHPGAGEGFQDGCHRLQGGPRHSLLLSSIWHGGGDGSVFEREKNTLSEKLPEETRMAYLPPHRNETCRLQNSRGRRRYYSRRPYSIRQFFRADQYFPTGHH